MKKIKILFLGILCVALVLPLIFFNFEKNYASAIDNRMLTEWDPAGGDVTEIEFQPEEEIERILQVGSLNLRLVVCRRGNLNNVALLGERRECFDFICIGKKILFRHWRKGDRFHPIGMSCSQKLQDIFSDQKIPRKERHQLWIAENELGKIFWVQNLRIGEICKIKPQRPPFPSASSLLLFPCRIF